MKKRMIIQRFNDKPTLLSRVEKLSVWCKTNDLAEDVSLRLYTSQDDETILVEKWGFPDSNAEKSFFASTENDLGPWPESDHAEGHGDLMLYSDKEWDE